MFKHKSLLLVPLLVLIFSACNFPGAGSTEDIKRAAAETIAAQLVDAVLATAPGEPADAQATEVPSDDGNPTDVPAPATNTPITPTETAETACDLAGFITDVTIPDGTDMAPGNTFTKTWRLVNNGSCDWTSGYQLVFFSGDQMNGPSSKQLTNSIISPGQTIDLSVNLTAPGTPGTYKGNWKIKNPSGEIFALNGSVPIFVEIDVVASPTATTAAPTATSAPTLVINFTAGYAGGWSCNGQARRSFKITNTGDLTIESMRIDLYGPIGTKLNGFSNNSPFRPVPPELYPQCVQAGTDSLGVGNVSWVGVHTNSPPPGGTAGRAIIKLCSAEDLGGSCKEVTVNFTW